MKPKGKMFIDSYQYYYRNLTRFMKRRQIATNESMQDVVMKTEIQKKEVGGHLDILSKSFFKDLGLEKSKNQQKHSFNEQDQKLGTIFD